MEQAVLAIYMVCALLFIFALGGLGKQETARRGNYFGIVAMILAIGITFALYDFNHEHARFWPAFILGGIIGLVLALRVDMISMPQLVAMLHSFVGLAAVLVAISMYIKMEEEGTASPRSLIEAYVGVFIGAITFTGSLVAYGKLDGKIRSSPLMVCGWGRHVLNFTCIMTCAILGVMFGISDSSMALIWMLVMMVIALFIGWHMVMAIGGADMPVVVSMLNSYSGWACAASGFLLENLLLIIVGALVGASGAILSYIMCRAMNRSFISVILGGFGQEGGSGPVEESGEEPKETNIKDFCKDLFAAKSVVIVPGYGMAVAKAQHNVGDIADILRKNGKKVSFCIHPVAGRLPGHMNVLLAEARVSYDIVKEMDEVNPIFDSTDMVLVVGANDIVNPDALDNPASPIAGMPVCEAWRAKQVIVFKRGKGQGYAGIENPLFIKPNTKMFYGSADKTMEEIRHACAAKYSAAENDGAAEVQGAQADDDDEPENFPEPVLRLGVPKEITPLENRVAVTPNSIKRLRLMGYAVQVETGAGEAAKFRDDDYIQAGASIIPSAGQLYDESEVVLKVRRVTEDEINYLGNVKVLISYFAPAQNQEMMEVLSKKYAGLNYLAMDCVPRITRAQKLDSLSSMGNIAGYRAVSEAFNIFQRCPGAQITAAGKLPPARVFIIGCGVAGLAATGYCKALGALVKAFDTRPAAREQAESLGAEFLQVEVQEDGSGTGGYAKEMSKEYQEAQLQMTRKACYEADIVITTALIPGRPAPKLIDAMAVQGMRAGSVIVDMAAENGGNCELTKPDQLFVSSNGVSIIGYTDLVSRMAPQSSELYATNLCHLLDEIGSPEDLKINMEDEIQGQMTIVKDGQITYVPPQNRPPPAAARAKTLASHLNVADQQNITHIEPASGESDCWDSFSWILWIALLCLLFLAIAFSSTSLFMQLFMAFILAIVIGYMIIWNVTPALHTPLMSVTNAISGIIVIGAMICLAPIDGMFDTPSVLGILAVFFASINVVGGFLVTQRMLNMFRKD